MFFFFLGGGGGGWVGWHMVLPTNGQQILIVINVSFFIIGEPYVLIMDLQIPFDIYGDHIWLLCDDTKGWWRRFWWSWSPPSGGTFCFHKSLSGTLISLSLSHTHTNRYMKLLWIYLWKGEGVCAVPDGLLLFFSCRGFLYTAWDTSDWLGANDSATIFFVISDVWTVLVTLHTMACALRTTRKFLTLICLLFLFFV